MVLSCRRVLAAVLPLILLPTAPAAAVRTVGTVPVANSCMTSQNIADVSIRNMLSENMCRLLIPCKMHLHPRTPSSTHYHVVLKKLQTGRRTV